MPFKSAKQKTTIDAAAHNPAFAKKIGVKTSDAKKMSAHGKGQTKFKEAKDTVEKDEKGNVKSWKHEGDWKKTNNKEGRGKVTNLSDKARRQTAKMSKVETKMAEAFELALEGTKSPTVTHGPNKGKKWSPNTPGPTNKDYKEIDGNIPSPPDGATAPPPGYKPPKTMKKAEVTPSVDADDTPMTTAESSSKKVMKKLRAKHMMESIRVLGQLIAEAKKITKKKNSKVKEDPNEGNAFGKAVADAKKDGIQKGEKVKVGKKEYPVKEAADDKCNHTTKGKKCPVHGLKECGSGMYESSEVNEGSVHGWNVVRANQKSGQLKLTKWLRNEAGLPKDAPVYFDDADLVYDDQTIVPNALVNTKLKMSDLLTAVQQAVQQNEPNMNEGNDGNLANNAKPYDKVTKGDVVAGRLGKDEMGGKSKKKKVKEGGASMPGGQYLSIPADQTKLSIGQQMARDGITYSPDKEDELIGLMSQYMKKAGMSSKQIRYYLSYDEDFIPDQLSDLPKQGVAEGKKKKVKEGWTHDTLAAQLFESGDEYMVALRNKLDKQIKG
jgi:hypothetical protein